METCFRDISELIHGYQKSQILFTATKLGIFELLASSAMPQSAADVAKCLNLDTNATERLLNACVMLKLLRTEFSDTNNAQRMYSNSKATNMLLLKNSPASLTAQVAVLDQMYSVWANLSSVLIKGQSSNNDIVKLGGKLAVTTHSSHNGTHKSATIGNSMHKSLTNGDAMPDYSANGEVMLKPAINGNSNIFNTENANGLYANRQQQETFLQAMHMFSAADVDSILGAVELGEYHTICDLGGGTGLLALRLALKYTSAQVILFDLPHVIQMVPKFLPDKLPTNLSLCPGDFFVDTLPNADLYILSHVVHDWGEERLHKLLHNVFTSLNPDGTLIVMEKLLNANKDGPAGVVLFDIGMLLMSEGRERTASEYSRLLKTIGFSQINVKPINNALFHDVIIATKL